MFKDFRLRLVAKVRSIYPDRSKKLSFLDFIKLTLMDFGWLILFLLIYSLSTNPPITKEIFWIQILFNVLMVGATFIHILFWEALVTVSWRINRKRKKKNNV